MADRLHRAFVEAGQSPPTMRMETFIGGGEGCTDWLQGLSALAESLVTTMEKLGVATAAEVDVTTLFERMRRDVISNGSMVFGRSEVVAWSYRALE